MISDVIIENEIYLLQEYFCQTGQSASAICHPERSRKRSLDRVDLRFGKDMELPRLVAVKRQQSTPSF